MKRTVLLCPKGHKFSAKHPIGRESNVTDCPLCMIEEIESELKILKKWIRQSEGRGRASTI